jgi:hypothetical protein
VVPAQALQSGAIWLVRDHRLHRSNATVGIKSVERVEVVDGLNPNDLVLISPLGKMADGQAVRTELIDPRAAALQNRPTEKADAFKGFK